ncbi:MAG TPA: efflux transporter outer membrane subunit [Steroidobacteraceae bacterium]|nr:efflux transporter outer membrane subunit [Steroidobacteraceae bacterium]
MAASTAALLMVLAGCATAPPRATPLTPLSASALGLQGQAVSPASEAWWKSLGDAQLDALMATALSGNPTLAQARARLRAAQAQAAAAQAERLPDIKLGAGTTGGRIPTGFGPYLLGGRTVWFSNLGASLSWNADPWGRQADEAAAARGLARAADLEAADARLLLTGAVAEAYLDLDRAYALGDVAASAEAQRARIVDITRQRVAAGLDTRVELREAQGEVPQTHLAVLQAQSAQALATHQLAALIGRGADAYAGIRRPHLDLQAVLPLPAALPINLLSRRPDVIAARTRIGAADASRRAARAAFYPSVNLSALIGFASISLGDLISAQSFGYGAGPALSLPLFDGGRLRAAYRGAEAGLDEAIASYDDTVLGAVRQAADQISLIDSLGSEQQQQRAWLSAAQEAYRLDEERYRAGLASYLSVLNAETEVLAARRQAVDLASARAGARISLLVAVGGSFQTAAAAVPAAADAHTAAGTPIVARK